MAASDEIRRESSASMVGLGIVRPPILHAFSRLRRVANRPWPALCGVAAYYPFLSYPLLLFFTSETQPAHLLTPLPDSPHSLPPPALALHPLKHTVFGEKMFEKSHMHYLS